MRELNPQPIKGIQKNDPLGNAMRNPLGGGLIRDDDWMWPTSPSSCIVSCKAHGPETWIGKNKPTRGEWWPVLIDGVWFWDRKPSLGQGIATLLPDHEANQKKETR